MLRSPFNNLVYAAAALSAMCTCSTFALAADVAAPASVPDSAFYVGLGASVNYNMFNDWDIDATGISDVYENGEKVASGTAGGPPVKLDLDSVWSFTPEAQLGYFSHFQNSSWLWGAKFNYNYLNSSSTRNDFRIPQYGSYGTTPFTGNALVQSMEVSLENQFSLVPYIGHDFAHGFIYGGVGPTLSQVKTNVTNLIGFADVQGHPTDISGKPQDFSSSDWVWGGAATIGVNYFVDENWFLDVNYSVSTTAEYTANYKSTFSNPGATPSDPSYMGDLIGKATGTFTTQSVMLSINRAF